MAINFIPRRGAILICNFDLGRVDPEVGKTRRVVVVSPRAFNHRHADRAGLCQVVPLSITKPASMDDRYVFIPHTRYKSITEDVWAKAGLVATVSHDRLDRPYANRRYHSEYVNDDDMKLIEKALIAAFGIIIPAGEHEGSGVNLALAHSASALPLVQET